MWQFSVGIYLNEIANGLLLLAAIFGFVGGGFVLVFGGHIGNWVDRNGRLKGISPLYKNLNADEPFLRL